MGHLEIIQAVATDYAGPLRVASPVSVGEIDHVYEWQMEKVEAVTVDGLSNTHGQPHVLYIDVDGFECAVLRGARETLTRAVDCFVEVHVGAGLENRAEALKRSCRFFRPAHTTYCLVIRMRSFSYHFRSAIAFCRAAFSSLR